MPRRLARELSGHDVLTVPQAGWAGLTNGALLARIDGAFDVFLTADQNLPAQQNLAGRSFGVVVLRSPSMTLAALRPLVPRILVAVARVEPGGVEIVRNVSA